MIVNSMPFTAARTALAVSGVRTHDVPNAAAEGQSVHWDVWAEQVRRSYTRPLKRHSLRISQLMTAVRRCKPLSSVLLILSAIAVCVILHPMLEQLAR